VRQNRSRAPEGYRQATPHTEVDPYIGSPAPKDHGKYQQSFGSSEYDVGAVGSGIRIDDESAE